MSAHDDLIETIELCIKEDGMTWAEAIREFRRETGWGLRACFHLCDRWKKMQKDFVIESAKG